MSTLPYTVRVAENSHYMDESEAYDAGAYPTLDDAEAACRKIVDDFLAANRKPGISAEALFKLYARFGEDPHVIGPGTEPRRFSAWDYARQHCKELAAG